MSARQSRRQDASSKGNYNFTNTADIRRVLGVQDEHTLTDGLTALRNQLTVRHDELPLVVTDARLLLAKAWLENSPGAGELFALWDVTTPRQTALLVPLVGVLSSVLALLSSHYLDHSLAQPILNALFLPQSTHRLNTYLGGTHNELTLTTLKLWYTLACFAGGRERKTVFEVFAWESKARRQNLMKLLRMRRKGKTEDSFDPFVKPDIRTLYMLFLLSFVDGDTQASIKVAFLEQRRDIFSAIFKGLSQDHYSVIRRVLEVCWTGVWRDPKVKRTFKVHVFNEAVLAQLIRVYERAEPENADKEHIPADVVHHFMLAVCTRPGVGVCFKDRGWYPRDVGGEETAGLEADEPADDIGGSRRRNSRINNKILANMLKGLKVNEDPRQQELALKIFGACPELVAGYWSAASLTLEPRLSSRWIGNIAFFGQVILLPVPFRSFYLHESSNESSTLYNPVPPPLATIMDNVLPAVTGNIKNHLSRGLQAASPLVRHCTALALAKCLMKYDAARRAFEEVQEALEEDEEGQWRRRWAEVEKEVRGRVPDWQVVVGFAQRSGEAAIGSGTRAKDGDGDVHMKEPDAERANPKRQALLAESAQRLVWLYQRCLPSLVAEARFDTGKLLLGLQGAVEGVDCEGGSIGLDILRQLHVLRLLGESDQFNWAGKAGTHHSNLSILLRIYVRTESPAIRATAASVVAHSLSSSLLFQHDPDEISLWLTSLPIGLRSPDAKAPDGATLTDERDAVVAFLDECAQRCAKTPYRYLEELQALSTQKDGDDADKIGVPLSVGEARNFPSPLLMTVVEQFGAKLKVKLLTPSECLAVVTYTRRLILQLMCKSPHLGRIQQCVERMREGIWPQLVFSEYPSVTLACQSEVNRLESQLLLSGFDEKVPVSGRDSAVETHLKRLESTSIPEDDLGRRLVAYAQLDWFRFLQAPLSVVDIRRLVDAVQKCHRPALRELFGCLMPCEHCLWVCLDIPARIAELHEELTFQVLLTHCRTSNLDNEVTRQILVDALLSASSPLLEITRGAVLVNHRLSAALRVHEERQVGGLLRLLAAMFQSAEAKLSSVDYKRCVEDIFHMDCVKQLCERPTPRTILDGLSQLLSTAFDKSLGQGQREVAGEFGHFWCLRLHTENFDADDIATARIWIKYMTSVDLFALLEHYSRMPVMPEGHLDLVEAMLGTVAGEISAIQPPPATVIALRALVPHSSQLEHMLARSLHDHLPLGHDGLLALDMPCDTLFTLISESTRRWSQRKARFEVAIQVEEFLQSPDWSDATVDIVISLIYRQPLTRDAVIEWLKGDLSTSCSVSFIARMLLSLLDCGSFMGTAHEDLTYLVRHCRRIVRALTRGKERDDASRSGDVYVKTVSSLIGQVQAVQSQLLATLQRECEKMNPDYVSPHVLRVVAVLSRQMKSNIDDVKEVVLENALPWTVQLFNSGEQLTTVQMQALVDLEYICTPCVLRKAQLVEPVLTAMAQSRLGDIAALCFTKKLVQAAHPKPVIVNRFLQSIVQHSQLYSLCGQNTAIRDGVVDLLDTLFRLHPSNTCQPTHVEPLLKLYSGSFAGADRKLLSIFRLFERTRKTSCAILLSRWSSSPSTPSSNALDAILSLDPNRVLKTCLDFPHSSRIVEGTGTEPSGSSAIYDPAFVLSLFSQVLSASPPSSALSWVQLLRTNIASLLVRTCSAKEEQLRTVAFAQLAALYKHIQDADLQEKPHVMHILNLMKDATKDVGGDLAPRLPAFTSLILAHALRAVFYPSNFIYPLTARFLLQRPELDTGDVPMLFGMLYNASDQWKKERAWIVRFLSDGIVGSEEWKIMQRRHTWDLLASLFQSEEQDRALRRGVLEVLANVTCNARATTSLIVRSGLFSWIEMQVRTLAGNEEALAWVKILANVATVVEPARIESATGGEWRVIFCRCLRNIIDSSACTVTIFVFAVNTLLRLVLLPGGPIFDSVSRLVRQCLRWLQKMEESLHIPALDASGPADNRGSLNKHSLPPHTSRTLFEHDSGVCGSAFEWGACVEALWRTTMTLERMCPEWDALTPRLLVWRAVASEASEVGEWVRKEVVRNLVSK